MKKHEKQENQEQASKHEQTMKKKKRAIENHDD
jgi:hypothetical protein